MAGGNVMSSPAVACRALASSARFASLATVAREPEGWPFATLVAVAFDARGRPLLLLSRLAEHTKNLLVSRRASLLVTETVDRQSDPLAGGRMTLVGECAQVPENERDEARDAFVAVHPGAAGYATFADFAMWRIEVTHVRWVGGFGRMDWIDPAAYADAR
jgi:heme iron utilization protein